MLTHTPYRSEIIVCKFKKKSFILYYFCHLNSCLPRPLSLSLLRNNLHDKVFKGTNGQWVCGPVRGSATAVHFGSVARSRPHAEPSRLPPCPLTGSPFFQVRWVTIGLYKLYNIYKTNLTISILIFKISTWESSRGILSFREGALHFFPHK